MTTRLALSEDPRRFLSTLWLDPSLTPEEAEAVRPDIIEALGEQTSWRVRHNITAPQHVLTVRSGAALGHTSDPWDNLQLAPMRWGLIPTWANHRKMGSRHTATTARGLRDNAAFAKPWSHGQRCAILASGFYAWQQREASRAPLLVTLPDLPVFAIAGVWGGWPGEGEEEWIESCALITTGAAGLAGDLAPAILDAAQIARWLDPDADEDALAALLSPVDAARFAVRPLSQLLEDAPEPVVTPQPPQLDLVEAIHHKARSRMDSRAEQLWLPWAAG